MSSPLLIGSQMYPAFQAFDGQPGGYDGNLETILQGHAAAGFDAWDQSLDSDEAADQLRKCLPASGLKLQSIYVGACLHTPEWEEGVANILSAARRSKSFGATIVTCNPAPIVWGGPENKNDSQLTTQSRALQAAGEALASEGMRFAYHWHDPEFRCGAREVWNVLLNTDPKVVGVCFDTHWTYRGAGDSQVALFDLLEFCLPRIVAFHVRQSREGVWSEAFGDGDIDYRRWAARIKKAGWQGPVLLEQAREEGTPKTMDFFAAQAQGQKYLRALLA